MNLAVFDIDGTLTRPYRIEDAAFLEGLSEALGFREVDPDWTKYPNVTDTGIVTTLCLDYWGRVPTSDEMSRFQQAYHVAFVNRVTPDDGAQMPGASSFVAGLREMPEWCIAIATGNCHRFAVLKLTRGAIPCLDVPMATADDAVSRADVIRVALDRARSHYGMNQFRHVVSVGDAPWDLRTARELGLPFVAVGPRCGVPPAAASMIADYEDQTAALSALAEAVLW
jgi:phosphoglycolate phosphatase-like HAD superfamily hydrolase